MTLLIEAMVEGKTSKGEAIIVTTLNSSGTYIGAATGPMSAREYAQPFGAPMRSIPDLDRWTGSDVFQT
jgi:hypothetical protein